jgi:hypothetical protein
MMLLTNTIYTFKLSNGDELVTKIKEIHADHLVIENPILTVLSPKGLQMMPALFSADLQHEMRLNTSSWVLVAETREDVRNSWIEATTGIRPATRQIITG